MNNVKKVIIIGAGASGVAAASRLYERGIRNILVIEATNRLGGRLHTIDLPDDDGFIEMGAQWIHGEENNVIYNIASPRDVLSHSGIKFDNLMFVRSSSEIVNENIVYTLWSGFEKIRATEDHDLQEKFQSTGHFFVERLNKIFEQSEIKIENDLQNELIEFCHQYINSVDGCDSWFDSASSTLREYWECPGNSYVSWKRGGYRTILDILMEMANKKSDGKFLQDHFIKNTRVRRIRMHEGAVLIECDNGQTYLTNHVIVTVSLGVLKENYKQMFQDIPLPKQKITAIENLGIGTVDKIYLKFPHQWWPENISGFSLLWRSEDKDGYVKQGLKWLTDVLTFSPVDNAPKVLCGWVTGISARTMEMIDEKYLCKYLVQVLRKFLSNKFEIPDADYCIRSNWTSDPNFRGSYSFRTPSCDHLGVSSTALSVPLTNEDGIPVILFAGEATHAHYYSTVHGAVEAGWREADRIISLTEKHN